MQWVSQGRLLLQPGHGPLRVGVDERLVQHLGGFGDRLGHHAAVRMAALTKVPLPQRLLDTNREGYYAFSDLIN